MTFQGLYLQMLTAALWTNSSAHEFGELFICKAPGFILVSKEKITTVRRQLVDGVLVRVFDVVKHHDAKASWRGERVYLAYTNTSLFIEEVRVGRNLEAEAMERCCLLPCPIPMGELFHSVLESRQLKRLHPILDGCNHRPSLWCTVLFLIYE